MGFAAFSYDVAAGAADRAAVAAAVDKELAPLPSWQLLSRLWLLEFPAIADFEAFGDALEALHAAHGGDFDYFALHFDPAGGPVVIAPNPAVRQPSPAPRARMAAPGPGGAAPAPAAAAPRAAIALVDPRPTLSLLEGLHARIEREGRARGPKPPRRRGGGARPRGRAAGRGPGRGGGVRKRKGRGGR